MAPAISINTDLKTFFVLIREIRIKKKLRIILILLMASAS